jgi:hypothetical protein
MKNLLTMLLFLIQFLIFGRTLAQGPVRSLTSADHKCSLVTNRTIARRVASGLSVTGFVGEECQQRLVITFYAKKFQDTLTTASENGISTKAIEDELSKLATLAE